MGPKGHASYFVPVAKPVGTEYMQQLTEEVICGLMAPNQPQMSSTSSFFGLSPHLRDTRVVSKAKSLAAAWNLSKQNNLEKSSKSPEFEDCGITPIPVTYGSNGKGLGSYFCSPVLLQDSANSGDLLPPQEPWAMDPLQESAKPIDYTFPMYHHQTSSSVSQTSWSGDTAFNRDAASTWNPQQISENDSLHDQPMLINDTDIVRSESNHSPDIFENRDEGQAMEEASAAFELNGEPEYDPLESLLQDLKEETHSEFDPWTPSQSSLPDLWTNNSENLRREGSESCIKKEDVQQDKPTGFFDAKRNDQQDVTLCGSTKAADAMRKSHSLLRTVNTAQASDPTEPQENSSDGAESSPRPRSKTSKHTGVSKHRKSGRWEVHIWLSSLGRQVYLGGYDDVDSAAEAYDLVQIRSRGSSAKTNFPRSRYNGQLEFISKMSLPELISHVRRGSKGFSRGVSEYRGVTLNPNGRWEARIGAYGSRHVYLGLYGNQKEAAVHYDCALVRLRGSKAATNFPLGDYKIALAEHEKFLHAFGSVCIGSLGRIASVKPQFELFLKYGNQETDLLIAAVRRMDAKDLPKLIRPGRKGKFAAKKKMKTLAHKHVINLTENDTPGNTGAHEENLEMQMSALEC